MRKLILTPLALCGVVLAAGCGEAGDSTSTTTMTGEDGEEVSIQSGGDLEAAFPAGFAPVPGATLTDAMDYSDGEKTTKRISFEAPQDLAELAEIYKGQAEMAGYSIRYSGESNGIHSMDGPHPDGGDFAFQAMKGTNGANTGTLTINSM